MGQKWDLRLKCKYLKENQILKIKISETKLKFFPAPLNNYVFFVHFDFFIL